jgi:hypothetical protein
MIKFCWLCSKKLWGRHKEVLIIDYYPRTLHKSCAKDIKRESDYQKDRDGSYHSMHWEPMGAFTD